MMKNLSFSLLLSGIIALLAACNSGQEQDDPLTNFRNYYSAVKEDPEIKWHYTTDTVKLWFDNKEGQPALQVKGKSSTGKWKEWDSVMNATARYDSIWYDNDEKAIKGFFYEDNDFYQLIGKSPTKTSQTYWLDEDNKIKEVLIYWIPEENTSTAEHLKPIVDWAFQYDSAAISALYPNGQIVPSKENAIRWKELLEKYKKVKSTN